MSNSSRKLSCEFEHNMIVGRGPRPFSILRQDMIIGHRRHYVPLVNSWDEPVMPSFADIKDFKEVTESGGGTRARSTLDTQSSSGSTGALEGDAPPSL